MEQRTPFDTLLVCGVPVLRWQGTTSHIALRSCQQILQALTRNGYREIVLDLQQAIADAPHEWQRLLSALEKMLPAHTHAEIVLPAGSLPARQLKRMRIAPSVALALSRITRLPAASLQAALTTHVRWQEIRDEE
ncbi:MAG: hypothetical protein KatS3mg022_2583 [Armatimonadota bacterium]|nr:MAG: hypothetical protein KatS3mg022_2583 [Armatimonadota bacterium]